MPEPIVLTARQWEAFEGVRDRRTPKDIATDMGVSRSYITLLLGDLQRLGVIIPTGQLTTPDAEQTEGYPWQPLERTLYYKPALPRAAKFRQDHPVDTERDLTVPPVRIVRWQEWTVQGILPLRPDQKPYKEALPDRRIVWAVHDAGAERLFTASRRDHWLESDTAYHFHRLVTQSDRRAMTQVIACAIGTPALLDMSTEQEATDQ
jgi:hypothetical protein